MEFDFDKNIQEPDFEKLTKLFIELEFKTLLEKVKKIYNSDHQTYEVEIANEENELKKIDKKKIKYHLVETIDGAKNLAIILADSKEFVFDTETDSLDTLDVNLAGLNSENM